MLGTLALIGIVVPTFVGARRARRRWFGANGAPAVLVETVAVVTQMYGVAYLLGAVGWFRRWPFVFGCIVVGAGLALVARGPGRQLRCVDRPENRPLPMWTGLLAGTAVVVVSAQYLAHTLVSLRSGMYDSDTVWYHGPIAARFVQDGWTTRLYFEGGERLVSYYPANGELAAAIATLPFHGDALLPLLNLGWLGLALLAGWCFGRRRGRGPLGLAAIAVAASLPIMASRQAGTLGTDLPGLALLLASVALLIEGDWQPPWLALSGIAAGLAFGVKLTLIPPVAVLGVAVLMAAPARRRLRSFAVWGAACAAPALYWPLRDWARTGNPIPWLSMKLGPLRLRAVPLPGERLHDTDVLHYLGLAGSVKEVFAPGLWIAFGPGWPAVLALAALGGISVAVAGCDRTHRAVAAVGLVGLALYTLIPNTVFPPPLARYTFADTSRYALPALAVLLAAIALSRPVTRPRVASAVTAVMVGLVVVAQVPRSLQRYGTTQWPLPARDVVLAFVIALFVAGAAPTLHRLGREPALVGAPALAGLALIWAIQGSPPSQYGATSYMAPTSGIFAWGGHLSHTRIARFRVYRPVPLLRTQSRQLRPVPEHPRPPRYVSGADNLPLLAGDPGRRPLRLPRPLPTPPAQRRHLRGCLGERRAERRPPESPLGRRAVEDTRTTRPLPLRTDLDVTREGAGLPTHPRRDPADPVWSNRSSAVSGHRVNRRNRGPQLDQRAGSPRTQTLAGHALHWPTRLALASAVWLAGAAVYYRTVWASGFDRLMGVDTDTRLIAFLCEHWFRVIHGQASWRNPPFYYPVKGLLGWSDAFFLYQFLYAPLRELGCGPELALQLTTILLSGIGFVTFYWLVRELFRPGEVIALTGALVFTFASNLYLHVAAAQLGGLYLLPGVALMAVRAWKPRRESPWRAGLLGTMAGALYGLLFFTTYYIALFAGLAVIVATLSMVLFRVVLRTREPDRQRVLDGRDVRLAALTGAGFVAGVTPFLLTYLPVHSSQGGVSERQVLFFSVNWRSLIDVGSGNVIWGRLVRHIGPTTGAGLNESGYALTPVLLAAIVVGTIWLIHRIRRGGSIDKRRATAAVVLATTALVLLLLPVRLLGKPPWIILWKLPGFDAIRAIDRIEVVASSIAAVAFVAIAAEARRAVLARPARSDYRLDLRGSLLALVLVLAVAEQLNTGDVSRVNRLADDRFLAAIPPAPSACRYFYLVDTGSVDRLNSTLPIFDAGSPIAQVDAMFIAQKVRLPTLNGYTGSAPQGWHLDPIGGPAYLAAVHAWEVASGAGTGACRLDLGSMTWTTG